MISRRTAWPDNAKQELSTTKYLYLAPILFWRYWWSRSKTAKIKKNANNTKEHNSSRLADFYSQTQLKYEKGKCNLNQPKSLPFTKY